MTCGSSATRRTISRAGKASVRARSPLLRVVARSSGFARISRRRCCQISRTPRRGCGCLRAGLASDPNSIRFLLRTRRGRPAFLHAAEALAVFIVELRVTADEIDLRAVDEGQFHLRWNFEGIAVGDDQGGAFADFDR